MELTPAPIPEVIVLKPRVISDERGFFMETFRAHALEIAGIPDRFVQENHSGSRGGVLRGLHYQIHHAQGKLVRAVVGEVFDVAVDMRRSSPTFGQWTGHRLSAENRMQIWIPEGFGHGFYVISEWAEIIYKVTDFYHPEAERTILWNDPALGIEWPIRDGQAPTISEKDANGALLENAELFD